MMRWHHTLILAGVLAGLAHAQPPGQPAPPQITPRQIQEAMLRQMQMMAVMFDLRPSRLSLDETVKALLRGAEKRGWKLGEVQDVQAAMKAQGAKDAPAIRVVYACPKDANERLAKASEGKAPPLPCRYTVFEGKDGKVQVMRLNTGNLAKGMQGETAKVLAWVAEEEEALLKGIVD